VKCSIEVLEENRTSCGLVIERLDGQRSGSSGESIGLIAWVCFLPLPDGRVALSCSTANEPTFRDDSANGQLRNSSL
jgi:hypothetical protein